MFAATWSGLLRCQSPDTQEALDTISTLQRQPPFVLDYRVDLPAPSQPSHHYFIAPDGELFHVYTVYLCICNVVPWQLSTLGTNQTAAIHVISLCNFRIHS